MSPSYNEFPNRQDRSIKVMNMLRSDKVGVPHPKYSALTAPKDDSDDDVVFVRSHNNLKMINKIVSEVATQTPPTSCHNYNSLILQMT